MEGGWSKGWQGIVSHSYSSRSISKFPPLLGTEIITN